MSTFQHFESIISISQIKVKKYNVVNISVIVIAVACYVRNAQTVGKAISMRKDFNIL